MRRPTPAAPPASRSRRTSRSSRPCGNPRRTRDTFPSFPGRKSLMKSRVVLVVLAVICALAGPAFAQQPDALKKAQAAFDQAQQDYLLGKFDEAAKGFEEAYNAKPFAQFLYNVGACHHMKGKKTSDVAAYQLAVDFYKKYLAADPQAADKPKVEKAIGVLEAEIKRLKDAAAQPPPATGSA